MKTLEEKIWDYIDGSSCREEHAVIKNLIANDDRASKLYVQFVELNSRLNSLEVDEPSMSFTRNVMDKIALEIKPVALKTRTDKRIIYSVGGFFVISLLSILVYALLNSNFTSDFKLPSFSLNFDASGLFSSTAIKVFLFVDLAIALLYIDGVVRRKTLSQKKGPAIS